MTAAEVHLAQVRQGIGEVLIASYGMALPARLLDLVAEFACEETEKYVTATGLLRRLA